MRTALAAFTNCPDFSCALLQAYHFEQRGWVAVDEGSVTAPVKHESAVGQTST